MHPETIHTKHIPKKYFGITKKNITFVIPFGEKLNYNQ